MSEQEIENAGQWVDPVVLEIFSDPGIFADGRTDMSGKKVNKR